jgi:hypothetical protein
MKIILHVKTGNVGIHQNMGREGGLGAKVYIALVVLTTSVCLST